MNKPVLKIIRGPSPTRTGLADDALAGTTPLFSALSRAVDLQPHDLAGLRQILMFRRGVARQASKRSRWVGGRLYNRCIGEDPDYIPVSATHLIQTLSTCNLNSPDFVVPAGEYAPRLNYAEAAIEALNQQLSRQG
jgi:hypothetical protein